MRFIYLTSRAGYRKCGPPFSCKMRAPSPGPLGAPLVSTTVNLHSSGFEGTSHLYSLLPKFVRAILIFWTFLIILWAGKTVSFYSVKNLETLERKRKEKTIFLNIFLKTQTSINNGCLKKRIQDH